MKRVLSKICLISFVCVGFSSCASIIHGRSQQIAVATVPAGAMITTGEKTVSAPGTIELRRNRDHVLTISKPGYETETVHLYRVLSGAVCGNIIVGGLPGWGVDAISGAQWRLVPETISVNLRPLRVGDALGETERTTSKAAKDIAVEVPCQNPKQEHKKA